MLLGVRVIPLEAEVGNVVVHGGATGALGLVPLDFDAGVQVILPVFGDNILLFEGISEVVGMTVAYIFNTKVVDDEAEEDREPFVVPNTRSGGELLVSVIGYDLFADLVVEDARLGEAVDTTVDFEVDPTISDIVKKVIFVNGVLRNVEEIDAEIFRTVQRVLEIEVRDVKGDRLGVFSGYYAVQDKLDKIQ